MGRNDKHNICTEKLWVKVKTALLVKWAYDVQYQYQLSAHDSWWYHELHSMLHIYIFHATIQKISTFKWNGFFESLQPSALLQQK